jgi:hypothetical protein
MGIKTPQEAAKLNDLMRSYHDYLRDGGYVQRIRDGYKSVRWTRENDPSYEPKLAYSSVAKSRPSRGAANDRHRGALA